MALAPGYAQPLQTGQMAYSLEQLHLRQVLEAGVWGSLADAERSAMRATCKDAKAMADTLTRTGVLRIPMPTPAAVAAFHRKLGVQQLSVQMIAPPKGIDVSNFFAEYAVATGGAGLPATSCLLRIPKGESLPLSALVSLLHALPQLRELTINIINESPINPQHLDALKQCQHLHTLVIICSDPFVTLLNNSLLESVCSLTQLKTFRSSWALMPEQLMRLSSLRKLSCLGLCELIDDGQGWAICTGACAHVTTLTGPPTPDEDITAPVDWDGNVPCLDVWPEALCAFPALERLHKCLLRAPALEVWDIQMPGLSGLMQKLHASAHSWGLCLWLAAEDADEMAVRLSYCRWPSLQYGLLSLEDFSSLPAPCTALSTCCSSLVQAAPSLTMLQINLSGTTPAPHEFVAVLCPALLQLRHLHTLWLGWPGLDGQQHTLLAMGLVGCISAWCTGGGGGGGAGTVAGAGAGAGVVSDEVADGPTAAAGLAKGAAAAAATAVGAVDGAGTVDGGGAADGAEVGSEDSMMHLLEPDRSSTTSQPSIADLIAARVDMHDVTTTPAEGLLLQHRLWCSPLRRLMLAGVSPQVAAQCNCMLAVHGVPLRIG